jgi:hypothetical protein
MSFRAVTVAETWEFRRSAESLMSNREIDVLIEYLAHHPTSGDVIEGTGGVRKLRWVLPGHGKRGGARAIFYYQEERYPLLAIAIFAKNAKSDLTVAERSGLKKLVEVLKRERRRT